MEQEKGQGSACDNGAVDDEKSEEEKMEQFFALIKRFREACKRRKDELEEMQKKKKKIRSLNDHPDQQQQSGWVPSFEREDFTEDIQFRKPPLIFPNPCNSEKGKQRSQKEEDDGLDLKLTL